MEQNVFIFTLGNYMSIDQEGKGGCSEVKLLEKLFSLFGVLKTRQPKVCMPLGSDGPPLFCMLKSPGCLLESRYYSVDQCSIYLKNLASIH